MSQKPTCDRCGAEMHEDDRNCPECGSSEHMSGEPDEDNGELPEWARTEDD